MLPTGRLSSSSAFRFLAAEGGWLNVATRVSFPSEAAVVAALHLPAEDVQRPGREQYPHHDEDRVLGKHSHESTHELPFCRSSRRDESRYTINQLNRNY